MSTAARQLRDAYDPFALIYDRDIAETFCRRALPAVERLLLSKLPPNARILDLCCGSGQFARELTLRGYRVAGLDGSEEMIRLARANAPGAEFILADAYNFSFTAKFDAVLSSFNSVAHANTVIQLETILGNARASLKPGGLLLFDLSMEEQYVVKWRGSFGEVHDDVAWIVRPSYEYKARTARNDITIFRRDAGSLWRREDFAFVQRCHSEADVLSALGRAGFLEVSSFDAERDLGIAKESGRRFFLCS